MDTSTLFDPARLPARDKNGFTYHPDLDGDRWQLDAMEEYLDVAKFRAAGFETASIDFEFDATSELVDSWIESGEPDCSAWNPSTPKGDGWLLIAIYDTEDGPIALYVRACEADAAA
ncbi:MAG: hypothetical protein WA777_15190 [Rhodanobacter sp.]